MISLLSYLLLSVLFIIRSLFFKVFCPLSAESIKNGCKNADSWAQVPWLLSGALAGKTEESAFLTSSHMILMFSLSLKAALPELFFPKFAEPRNPLEESCLKCECRASPSEILILWLWVVGNRGFNRCLYGSRLRWGWNIQHMKWMCALDQRGPSSPRSVIYQLCDVGVS